MRLFALLLLVSGAVTAATISRVVTCDGSPAGCGSPSGVAAGAQVTTDPLGVSVFIDIGEPGHVASSYISFQADYLLTVLNGPVTFDPSFTVLASETGHAPGGECAGGSLIGSPGQFGASTYSYCGPNLISSPVTIPNDVPELFTLTFIARADEDTRGYPTTGYFPAADEFASASINLFPDTQGVMYTFVEVPEPGCLLPLLLAGAAGLLRAIRGTARAAAR